MKSLGSRILGKPSKINQCINKVLNIWEEQKGTQNMSNNWVVYLVQKYQKCQFMEKWDPPAEPTKKWLERERICN